MSLLLLIMALIPSACGHSDMTPSPGAEGLNAAAQNGPEAAAGRFLTVCLAGDWATALELLLPETRGAVLGWGGGNPCSQVPAGADAAVLAASERVGQTAYVTYSWSAEDGDALVEYQLLLTRVDSAWLIFDGRKTRQRPTPMLVTPAPTVAPPGIVPTRRDGGQE